LLDKKYGQKFTIQAYVNMADHTRKAFNSHLPHRNDNFLCKKTLFFRDFQNEPDKSSPVTTCTWCCGVLGISEFVLPNFVISGIVPEKNFEFSDPGDLVGDLGGRNES
jgi:hypothetical protein